MGNYFFASLSLLAYICTYHNFFSGSLSIYIYIYIFVYMCIYICIYIYKHMSLYIYILFYPIFWSCKFPTEPILLFYSKFVQTKIMWKSIKHTMLFQFKSKLDIDLTSSPIFPIKLCETNVIIREVLPATHLIKMNVKLKSYYGDIILHIHNLVLCVFFL